MPILGPPPAQLPQQRSRALLPSAAAASIGVGSASLTFSAQAVAPIGAGSASLTLATAAAAQWTAAAAGSASLTLAANATSTNIFPLTASPDGRYLRQADGTPFLIRAQTTWSLAVDIPLSGIASFLSSIQALGFNAVMMNAIEHHYTVVKPPAERGGNLPFTKRLDGTTYTGSPNGTTGAAGTQGQFASDNYSSISTQAPDPTFINNAYWQAVEQILDACLARNVLVFVWPAYLGFHAGDEGWLQEMVRWDAVTGAGGFVGQSFADNTKSRIWNYGAWLAARWKNYPNIVWIAGGDYGANTQTLSTTERAAVTNWIAGMKSVSGQASNLWSAHWERPCLASDTTITGITWDMNLAYADDACAELTRRGYAAAAGPTFLGEYFYEGGLFGGSAPYRRYMWWGFLGGIAGGFFGNEQLWRFDDGTPGTDYTTLLATQGTLDAQRLFTFLTSRPWHRLKPSGLGGMGTLVTVGGGTESPQSSTYVAAAATSEGDLLIAYVPPAHTGSITVDMTKMAAMARARWFDPTNGAFTDIGAFANTGTRAFTAPASNSAGDADFLLVLETVAGSASLALSAVAVGAPLVAVSGSASISVSAQGVGQSQAQASGSASLSLTAAAVSGTVIQGVGSSSLALAASAVGAWAVTAAGSASLAVTAAAVGTATATAAGQAGIAFTAAAAGSATGTGPATGAASVALTATATGAALATAVGTAAFAFTATARSTVVVPDQVELSPFEQLVAEMDQAILSVLG